MIKHISILLFCSGLILACWVGIDMMQVSAQQHQPAVESAAIKIGNAGTPGAWELIAEPDAWNSYAELVLLDNNKILYLGGRYSSNSNGASNEVFAYDPTTDDWSTMPAMQEARVALGAASHNGMVYAIGGSGPDGGDFRNSVERFDSASNNWSYVAPMNFKRSRIGATTFNNLIYVFGGIGVSGSLDSIEIYYPDDDYWLLSEDTLPDVPTNCADHYCGNTAVVAGNQFYVFIGQVAAVPKLWRYDPSAALNNRWTAMPPPSRNSGIGTFEPSAAAVNGLVTYLPGSLFESYPLELFNTVAQSWQKVAKSNDGHAYGSSIGVGGYIYAIGGRTNDVKAERYDPRKILEMTSPETGKVYSGTIPITGSADRTDLAGYRLYWKVGSAPDTNYQALGPLQTTPVFGGQLGVWDTLALNLGESPTQYTLKVEMTETTGLFIDEILHQVIIDNRGTVTLPPADTPTHTATPSITPITTTPSATIMPAPGEGGDDYENNDSCTNASIIDANGTIQEHTFHDIEDEDWIRFDATANMSYTVEANVPALVPVDLLLELYDKCGGGASETQDLVFTPSARLTFSAPTAGTYYFRLLNTRAAFGNHVRYNLSLRALSESHETGALLIVAGAISGNDPARPYIHNVTNSVYRLWRNQGYQPDQIRYLATDQSLDADQDGQADVHGLPSKGNVGEAITDWAKEKVTEGRPFTIYLADHGNYDKFYLDEARGEILTPADLDGWLAQLESAVPGVLINVIIEACGSGSFIDPGQSISKPGRVVITSAAAYELAYTSYSGGAVFSDAFLDGLALGRSLFGAFQDARYQARSSRNRQTPWFDDNGNGVPNDSDDGLVAAGRSFRVSGGLPGIDTKWKPAIVEAEVREPDAAVQHSRPPGTPDQRREIWVEIRDNQQVQTVWAIVYPPSYQPPTAADTPDAPNELVIGPPPITLQPRGNNLYAGTYGTFDEGGSYRIVIYAIDDEGLHSAPAELFYTRLYLPMITR